MALAFAWTVILKSATELVTEIMGGQRLNKSLQRTFDPPPFFAAAITGVASNAAELSR